MKRLDRMLILRRISAVVIGAYVVLWAPALIVRFVEMPDAAAIALIVLGGAIGAYGGYHEGRALAPFSGREHRDAVIGCWVVAVVAIARTLLGAAPVDA